jgi:hypothetical protein
VHREQEREQGQVVASKLLDAARTTPVKKARREYGPVPLSHSWRRFDYSENSMQAMERRGDICILRK